MSDGRQGITRAVVPLAIVGEMAYCPYQFGAKMGTSVSRGSVFRSIDRSRAFEAVVTQVERSLAEGRYPVGTRLPSERDLADEFGVSRVVIREAMRFLESRGYVTVRQGSGTYVRDADTPTLSQDLTLRLELEEASLVELYVVRQALELATVRLAAERATDELVAELDRRTAAMRAITARGVRTLDDYMRRRAEDEAFHLAIASASGNGLLFRLVEAILPLCSSGHFEILRRAPSLETFLSPAKIDAINDEHERLAMAIRNGDGRAAEVFIYSQMQRSIATWQESGARARARRSDGRREPEEVA